MPAIIPVFPIKSPNVYPSEVPMITFGGSPHIVAAPPRFAQKISAKIIGTGLNERSRPSSAVIAAKNKITVILSMNIDKKAERSMNATKTLRAR